MAQKRNHPCMRRVALAAYFFSAAVPSLRWGRPCDNCFLFYRESEGISYKIKNAFYNTNYRRRNAPRYHFFLPAPHRASLCKYLYTLRCNRRSCHCLAVLAPQFSNATPKPSSAQLPGSLPTYRDSLRHSFMRTLFFAVFR